MVLKRFLVCFVVIKTHVSEWVQWTTFIHSPLFLFGRTDSLSSSSDSSSLSSSSFSSSSS